MHTIRNAKESDVTKMAQLWHDGWHDAHAEIVPEALVCSRTLDSFTERTRQHLGLFRVAGEGTIEGMCLTKADELSQLYVAKSARGTGLAMQLVTDSEQHIARSGASKAWLACAIGNERAAAFYKKCGWVLTETVTDDLETPEGGFSLEVWRFEKHLYL